VEVFLNKPTVGEIPEILDNYSRPFVYYFQRYGAFSLQSSQLEIWTARNLAKAEQISNVKLPCLGMALTYVAEVYILQVVRLFFPMAFLKVQLFFPMFEKFLRAFAPNIQLLTILFRVDPLTIDFYCIFKL
jgi:hypothetical protein